MNAQDSGIPVGRIIGVLVVIGVLAVGGMVGCPQYSIYEQRATGEAELARAQSNRMVAVSEAQAKREAAVYLASADSARAEGVAKANRIIGASLEKNEAYLSWLWIDNLKETKDQIIYVPTEANMPVLEAGRLRHPVALPTDGQ